jgi:hypothetical protein
MKDIMRDELGAPKVVDRSTFQAELDALRVREKAHTREGDAIAAARRRLPMVEVDGATPLRHWLISNLPVRTSMAGDTAKAKAAYQDLFALWKDADSEIPMLSQARAEYANLR